MIMKDVRKQVSKSPQEEVVIQAQRSYNTSMKIGIMMKTIPQKLWL